MQTDDVELPLQQPPQFPGPQTPGLVPPSPLPAQVKSMQARVPQLAHEAPFWPQLATLALLGETTHLPAVQQPWQLAGPQVGALGADPQDGATASMNPKKRPNRSEGMKGREVISNAGESRPTGEESDTAEARKSGRPDVGAARLNFSVGRKNPAEL